ncbi:hypothetical protein ACFYY1_28615 [Streptomyces sp. NPDC001890]|uniref:hypothetical protein n=1 Tax=Streptomyces sp. NPDC001890 TaxID=3364620 RepID=UPI0036C1F308
MTEHPGFGAILTWLLDHRELSAQELAVRAGTATNDVQAVLAGKSPGEMLLRRLASALGLHAVDLFILAGWEVPEDLAPLDATAATWTASTVTDAVRLPAAGRCEVLRLIRSLPQEERRSGFAPKTLVPVAGGPGARVVRMLQFRNLNWMGMAKALAFVTPTYLSASTYGVIGAGRKELTPRLVTDFATLLGIDAAELAALTGVFLREEPPSPSPEAVDAAELLWEMRRLSAAQARHVSELARSRRRDTNDGWLDSLSGP